MPDTTIPNAPVFFTQIPSFLRGRGLLSSDKMVFGTIYTMLNVTNYCCMSNKKIAEETELKPQTISTIVSKLRKKGLIKVSFTYKENSKQIDKRIITLGDLVYENQGVTPYDQNHTPPYDSGHIPPRPQSKGNRLFNRLSNNNNKGSLKSYFDVWDEPNKLIQNKLLKLIEKHGQKLFDYAVIKTAEVNATKNSSYKYMSSLLSDWSKNGVTDVSKAKAYVEQRKAKRKPKKSNYGHTPKKENLPEWATKTPEERKAERDKQKADHEYKMKHDPEYRKKQEQSEKEQVDRLKKIRSWRKDADA